MAGVSGCLGDSRQSASRKPILTSDRRTVSCKMDINIRGRLSGLLHGSVVANGVSVSGEARACVRCHIDA